MDAHAVEILELSRVMSEVGDLCRSTAGADLLRSQPIAVDEAGVDALLRPSVQLRALIAEQSVDVGLDLPEVSETIGISGLEYDSVRDRLYVLASFETEDSLGGYLVVFEGKRGFPALMRDGDGRPYRFSSKPEGVTVLEGDRLLVVFDGDRVETPVRKRHQAEYVIFRCK